MSLAQPKMAWRYAAICTVASVLGGIVGYAIGALLFDTVGQWLINLYGYGAKMERCAKPTTSGARCSSWSRASRRSPTSSSPSSAGCWPIISRCSCCCPLITRGARFFILAGLLNRFGDQIRTLLERYFGWFMVLILVFIVIGFVSAAKLV